MRDLTALGVSCWWGNYMSPSARQLDAATQCQVSCAGNENQLCGGNYEITVYSNAIFTPTTIGKWAALGDSYSAGPAAGTYLSDGDDPKRCLRYTGSYPVQMKAGDAGAAGACVIQENDFIFLSCTGAKWEQTDADGGSPLVGEQFQPLSDFGDVDFVTLSSGGNDVFFARIVDNCLYQINWSTSRTECDTWRARASIKLGGDIGATMPSEMVLLLVEHYKLLLDSVFASPSVKPHFHVFITGYTPFYNTDSTSNCQTLNLYYWTGWPTWAAADPYELTSTIRILFNNLVTSLNENIQEAIREVNRLPELKYNNRLTFIDGVDTVFSEGQHLFCEDDVIEPDYNRADTWYYQPAFWNSQFSDDDFPDIDAPITEDDARAAIDGIYGTGYFDLVVQEFAEANGGNLRPWSWVIKFFVGFARTYHPTPDGYAVQAQKTCQAICSQFPLVQGTPLQGATYKCDASGIAVPV
jgi:hypothetical protein